MQIVLGSEGVVIVNDSAVGEPTIAHLPGTYRMQWLLSENVVIERLSAHSNTNARSVYCRM